MIFTSLLKTDRCVLFCVCVCVWVGVWVYVGVGVCMVCLLGVVARAAVARSVVYVVSVARMIHAYVSKSAEGSVYCGLCYRSLWKRAAVALL